MLNTRAILVNCCETPNTKYLYWWFCFVINKGEML